MLRRIICLAGVLCLILTACQPNVDYDADGPRVSAQDFSVISGDWVGNLTYTDYSSGKPIVIASNASVTSISNTKIKYTLFYPNEPWEDSESFVNVSKDGRLLNGHVITGRMMGEDGVLIVTTQHSGDDDNRPTDIRQVYGLSPKNFYIRKDVKFDDVEAYLTRNIYVFKRPKE